MRSKSLFISKTFWLNLLGIAAMALPGVPLAPETLAYVMAGLNIAVRVLTNGPAHVIKDAATEP